MNWTTQPPTKPGAYWYREPNAISEPPRLLLLAQDGDSVRLEAGVEYEYDEIVAYFVGEWCGPLVAPEAAGTGDTPRTDRHMRDVWMGRGDLATADFARELERELESSNEELAEAVDYYKALEITVSREVKAAWDECCITHKEFLYPRWDGSRAKRIAEGEQL